MNLADRIAGEVLGTGSILPADPSRGVDAEALRAHFGTTPAEELMRIVADPNASRGDRLRAATALLPYCHKPQTVTSKLQGDPDAPLGAVRLASKLAKHDDETLAAIAVLSAKGVLTL